MKVLPFIFLMILMLPLSAAAEKIYKTVDESGAVVFSDKKTPGAEKITVQPNVVDVNIPVMPERAVVDKKPRTASANTNKTRRAEEQGRGVATGGNLKRKIQNVTNGKGIKRPGHLPARGQGGQRAGAGGGGRGGGR